MMEDDPPLHKKKRKKKTNIQSYDSSNGNPTPLIVGFLSL
jgi:hypothetical protein